MSDDELLRAFDKMCKRLGKVSRGFEPNKITAPIDGDKYDGTSQWAISYTTGFGYMIVCGAGGCGCALGRSGGYIKKRWNLLMLIEAVDISHWLSTISGD